MFSLCYEKTPCLIQAVTDNSKEMPECKATILFFPWYVQNQIDREEMKKLWPDQITLGDIPLKCIFTFEHCIPTSLFEQFSVQLHGQLTKGYIRKDWKGTIYVNQNAIELLVQTAIDNNHDLASLVIEFRTKAENFNQMYQLCVSVVKIIQLLRKVFPGILYDEEYVCPHCMLTNALNPTTLPLDDALEGYPGQTKVVYCCTEIPAVLHYPRLSGK